MALITFEDLPSTNTPIDSTNLNNNFSYTSPVGGIMEFAGSTAPTGWLICDGSAISRTTYADLYNVIGTTYGTGDGSTTFNLPNLKGRVPVGKDTSQTEFDVLGETGGEKTHTLTVNEIPSHRHELQSMGYEEGSVNIQYTVGWGYTRENNPLYTTTTGGGQAHNILQPYIVLNYIIKY